MATSLLPSFFFDTAFISKYNKLLFPYTNYFINKFNEPSISETENIMLTYNRKQNRVGQDVSFAEILIIFNHFFINFMSFIRNLNEFHCNLYRLFIKKLGILELLINLGYFSKCMYCFNHKHVSGYFCLLLVKKLHLL